ncbi:hypothetical protein ACFLTD_03815, partial [Elusimicrobiota bacterium]
GKSLKMPAPLANFSQLASMLPQTIDQLNETQERKIQTHKQLLDYMPGEDGSSLMQSGNMPYADMDLTNMNLSEVMKIYSESVEQRQEFMDYLKGFQEDSTSAGEPVKHPVIPPFLKEKKIKAAGKDYPSLISAVTGSMAHKPSVQELYKRISYINQQSVDIYTLSVTMIVLIAFIFSRTFLGAPVFFLSKMCFFWGRISVLLIAVMSVFFWIIIRKNLWLDAGFSIYLGPVGILMASCFALRTRDPNYPVFNRILLTMSFPVSSSLYITYSNCIY